MAAWASALEAWAEVEVNRSRKALQQLALALAQIETIGNNSFRSYFSGMYAEACLRMGEIATAMETVDAAFALMQNTGERFWEAELTRLSGEIRLAAKRAYAGPEVRQVFERAVELAEVQGAELLAGRARNSLDRLRRRIES